MKIYQKLLSKGAFYMAMFFYLFSFIFIMDGKTIDWILTISIGSYFMIQYIYFTKKYMDNKIV